MQWHTSLYRALDNIRRHAIKVECVREGTYNVDVIACVGNRDELSIVREAERGDGMTGRNMGQRRTS